jgi:hypothetical protein
MLDVSGLVAGAVDSSTFPVDYKPTDLSGGEQTVAARPDSANEDAKANGASVSAADVSKKAEPTDVKWNWNRLIRRR